MTRYCISGGRPLRGTVRIGGAKNALLPVLAATLLHPGVSELRRCPHLRDVENTVAILRHLGCRVTVQGDTVTVDSAPACRTDIPASLAGRCRASICFLAPLLARFGKCRIAYPGGCAIGARPIDYHIRVLHALGSFTVREAADCICVEGHFTGGCCRLPYPSVGATECACMAGAACKIGSCTLYGSAQEPEIADLRRYLQAVTAARRTGVRQGACERVVHTVMADRIESGTYAIAAAATRGDVEILDCMPAHMTAVTDFLRRCGARISAGPGYLRVDASGAPLRAVPLLTAGPYPAFPTDLQAPACALLATCPGRSVVCDAVFPQRFRHIAELRKLGAAAEERELPGGHAAVLDGRTVQEAGRTVQDAACTAPLLWQGKELVSTDLRAGAALLIAGLCAKGEGSVVDDGYITRGYENISGKLRALGAQIAVR